MLFGELSPFDEQFMFEKFPHNPLLRYIACANAAPLKFREKHFFSPRSYKVMHDYWWFCMVRYTLCNQRTNSKPGNVSYSQLIAANFASLKKITNRSFPRAALLLTRPDVWRLFRYKLYMPDWTPSLTQSVDLTFNITRAYEIFSVQMFLFFPNFFLREIHLDSKKYYKFTISRDILMCTTYELAFALQAREKDSDHRPIFHVSKSIDVSQ